MTGEMYAIDQDGKDSDGNYWPIHAAIARSVKGKLCPFDVYQGPYITVRNDIRVGQRPYQVAPLHLGAVRLWISSDDGAVCTVYREDTETESAPFWYTDTRSACREARKLLTSIG